MGTSGTPLQLSIVWVRSFRAVNDWRDVWRTSSGNASQFPPFLVLE